MQPDPPDTVPVPTSSPPLSPFRPQAALAHEDVRLRRTHGGGSTAFPPPALLRLHLVLPAEGAASRVPWAIPPSTSVRDAKAAIAAGAAGARWEPAGIRLIWRGRLLRDDEVLGAVLAGFEEPKVHVVARPVTPSERPQPQWETPQQERAQAQAFVPVTDSDSLAEQIARNASTLVRWNPPASATPLADTVHYLMFAAREHMCVIVGRPVLAWEETDPKPTVSRAEAYEAILTVVRAHAGDQWADALQADGDKAAIERAYVAIGRDIAMAEVKYLWRALVGREYGEKGATTQVEFDNEALTLHLPALEDMVPKQLIHLVFYLRTTSLIRFLSIYLSREIDAASEATARARSPAASARQELTPPPADAQRVVYQQAIRIRVPRLRISFSLMQQLFWSAVRLVVVLWMITRGVPWTDHRVWYLTGAALAYWLYEGYTHWSAENEARESRRRRAERAAAAAGPDAAEADAPLHAAAAAHAAVAGIRIRPPGAPAAARRQSILLRIPYLHMDVDAEQLRVHLHFAGPGLRREEPDVVELRPEPRSHPTAVVRQLALGVALWAVTLIPAFEAMRAREIRSRERTMRAVVVALNPEESQEQNQSQNQEDENTEQESDAPPPPPRELVLPSGLSVQARKYYLRVASTTEAIDWEEEREAQRAMGIPDEEEDARAGFIGGLL